MDKEKEIETAWLEEINRRVESLDSGDIKTVSWEEARKGLHKYMDD